MPQPESSVKKVEPGPVVLSMNRVLHTIALLLLTSSAVVAGPPVYGPDEIRRGITKDAAISRFKALGYKVVEEASPEMGVTVRDGATNRIIGLLFFCGGRLFANTTDTPGGAAGLIRRVAQFNASHGKPTVDAKSQLLDELEFNNLKFSWSKADDVITIEFQPASSGVQESQWITYSVPSVCKQR